MSEYDAKYFIRPIFGTTPITEELLEMPPADGSTIPQELWKRGDDSQLSVNENISLCKLRHKNGNCLCDGENSFEIQDILDYLDAVLHPIVSPEYWNVYSELYDMISMLPSAERHGRWVETDTYPKCSVCGLYGVSDMNYCPNCGARMEGEEE